jgi:hypothetical protein
LISSQTSCSFTASVLVSLILARLAMLFPLLT